MTGPHRLVILYGVGGLSDVGRHAILAALERPVDEIAHITVLTRHPNLIFDETNWKCACPEPHIFSDHDKERMTIVPIQSWKDDNIVPHFQSATAVITALGNRQPFLGHNDATEGNDAVLHAIHQRQQQASNNNDYLKQRVVICSSVGIEEDWPPLEFFTMGRVALSMMFRTCSKRNFNDLTTMERHYKATDASNIDFLVVRPVGLGEDVKPVNAWALQKTKHVDKIGFDMAKVDCARFMVEEAIHPTRHRDSVVIGAVLPVEENK